MSTGYYRAGPPLTLTPGAIDDDPDGWPPTLGEVHTEAINAQTDWLVGGGGGPSPPLRRCRSARVHSARDRSVLPRVGRLVAFSSSVGVGTARDTTMLTHSRDITMV